MQRICDDIAQWRDQQLIINELSSFLNDAAVLPTHAVNTPTLSAFAEVC